MTEQTYNIGDKANGYVLTEQGWVLDAGFPPPPPAPVAEEEKKSNWRKWNDASDKARFNKEHGPLNDKIPCPVCGVTGQMHVKQEKQKKGISGGKASAAILTGGVSLLATGLASKGMVTVGFCENCKMPSTF